MTALAMLYDISIMIAGLMAGVYLCWAISVLPGLALLSDVDYVNAFQQFNRAILNPAFLTLFFAAIVVGPITAAAHMRVHGWNDCWPVLVASVLLVVGHGAVTILGNIPINNVLERFDIDSASDDSVAEMRETLSTKWRAFHWGRTVATIAAFATLLIGRPG